MTSSRFVVAGNTNSYHSYSLSEALDGIAAAGFGHVELSAVRGWTEHVPLESGSAELTRIRKLLASVGLTPVSLGGHSDLSTDEGVKLGQLALNLCGELEVSILITAAGREGGEQRFIDNIRQLAEDANRSGVRVAIEVAGDLAPTGKDAAALLDRIDHSNVFINYDTANVEYYGGIDARSDLQGIVDRIAHVHLKDKRGGRGVWDFPPIGQGHVDFKTILALLRDCNFDGPLSVEVEFLGEPWPPIDEVNRGMKASYEALGALGVL